MQSGATNESRGATIVGRWRWLRSGVLRHGSLVLPEFESGLGPGGRDSRNWWQERRDRGRVGRSRTSSRSGRNISSSLRVFMQRRCFPLSQLIWERACGIRRVTSMESEVGQHFDGRTVCQGVAGRVRRARICRDRGGKQRTGRDIASSVEGLDGRG